MGDSQGEVAVAAGDRGQMPVGPLRRLRASGVDDDELAAAPLGVTQERHEVWGRADRVVSPENHKAAMNHVFIGRTPTLTEGDIDGVLGRRATDAAPELAGPQA